MQGFVICSLDEELTPHEFWTGQILDLESGKAQFFSDRPSARYELGVLQAKYPESELAIKKATLSITIS